MPVERVFSNNRAQHLLRKTTLFGVYRRGLDGRPVPPCIMPNDVRYEGLINPYYPDILNDLQLTDHYPVLQRIRLGEVETSVFSLNCMKQCEYLEVFNGYNNAFDKVESPEEYGQRLDLLADLIIALIEDNRPVTFSLQEAPNYKTPLGRHFYEKIKRSTGWDFVLDDTSNDKAGIVTLYNSQQLEYRADVQSSTKNLRLQAVTFRNKYTKQDEFQCINMHGKLPDSVRYARLIAERTTHDSPPTIITGDSNIPASEDAIQALSGTSSPQALHDHREALRILNEAGAYGAYTIVQGTLVGSKGGVDTLDVLTASPSLRTNSYYGSDRLPRFNKVEIETKRTQNEQITQGIRPYLQQTVRRLGRVFTPVYPALSAEYCNIQVAVLPGSATVRVVSFASEGETQAFSNRISREFGIEGKRPKAVEGSGRFSILLGTEQLDIIESHLRKPANVEIPSTSANQTIEYKFRSRNPDATIESRRIAGHDELRIISFSSKDAAQAFSNRIKNDLKIKLKEAQAFGNEGRFSVLINIGQLEQITNTTRSQSDTKVRPRGI
jgi:hypothetical protein